MFRRGRAAIHDLGQTPPQLIQINAGASVRPL